METESGTIKETSSLSQSRKGPKTCYGATRNPELNAVEFKLITHNICYTDTLQGLAVKYGVTVEQIRRANKLWTNDNIHIFETINIPVKLECADGYSLNGHIPESSNVTTLGSGDKDVEYEICVGDIDIEAEGYSRDKGRRKTEERNSEESLKSFLKKLDSEMKVSIKNANKQRAKGVPPIFEYSGESHDTERVRKNSSKKVTLSRGHKSSPSDNESLDDLFEL